MDFTSGSLLEGGSVPQSRLVRDPMGVEAGPPIRHGRGSNERIRRAKSEGMKQVGIQIHEKRNHLPHHPPRVRPYAHEVGPKRGGGGRVAGGTKGFASRVTRLPAPSGSCGNLGAGYRSDTLRPLASSPPPRHHPLSLSLALPERDRAIPPGGGANKRYRITYVGLGGASANKVLGPRSLGPAPLTSHMFPNPFPRETPLRGKFPNAKPFFAFSSTPNFVSLPGESVIV